MNLTGCAPRRWSSEDVLRVQRTAARAAFVPVAYQQWLDRITGRPREPGRAQDPPSVRTARVADLGGGRASSPRDARRAPGGRGEPGPSSRRDRHGDRRCGEHCGRAVRTAAGGHGPAALSGGDLPVGTRSRPTKSLPRYLVEEAYEVVEAVETLSLQPPPRDELVEELGDGAAAGGPPRADRPGAPGPAGLRRHGRDLRRDGQAAVRRHPAVFGGRGDHPDGHLQDPCW
ncbi:MazG nucleotide pyrophosphohydrolase domain-containing protein [Kocuria rhizophila]|nr:MazG nucleotide pyrophosphohydrolase domain-containing protein [Kocuria rhizophila]